MLAATGLSSIGDFLALAALALHLHDTGRSPVAMSALMLAGMLPLVLLGPVAGMAVDRFETAALLRVMLAAQALLATTLAFTNSLEALLGLVFALGAGNAVTQSGLLALLPSLAARDSMVRVNGWFEACRSVGVTLGPPLGGLTVGFWGVRGALLADAATFVVLCAALWLVPVRQPRGQPAGRTVGGRAGRLRLAELSEGMTYIARDPELRLAVGVFSAAAFFLAGVNVAEVFFARDTLHAGDAGYGTLVGAWGLGMVVGALGTARWAPAAALLKVVITSALVAGTAVALAGAFPALPVALAGWLAAGAANGTYQVALRSLLHRRTPSWRHGQVFAAQHGAYNAAKTAAMVATGPAVGLLHPRATIVVIGVAAAVIGAAGLLRVALRGTGK